MSSYEEFVHLKLPVEEIKNATNNFAQENLIRQGGFGKTEHHSPQYFTEQDNKGGKLDVTGKVDRHLSTERAFTPDEKEQHSPQSTHKDNKGGMLGVMEKIEATADPRISTEKEEREQHSSRSTEQDYEEEKPDVMGKLEGIGDSHLHTEGMLKESLQSAGREFHSQGPVIVVTGPPSYGPPLYGPPSYGPPSYDNRRSFVGGRPSSFSALKNESEDSESEYTGNKPVSFQRPYGPSSSSSFIGGRPSSFSALKNESEYTGNKPVSFHRPIDEKSPSKSDVSPRSIGGTPLLNDREQASIITYEPKTPANVRMPSPAEGESTVSGEVEGTTSNRWKGGPLEYLKIPLIDIEAATVQVTAKYLGSGAYACFLWEFG
ncbi:hypothetical protein L1987_84479 [Smallanthus sonchifolius]|uniref:Uncharacterized protein n=1 Tax=Smallanthus sonchifolius TaxID=185202 RepID=A0ACB8YFH3_9ASTR|nr:hypothetical protein L1987_84479 [Smallanthus sonchifolius]